MLIYDFNYHNLIYLSQTDRQTDRQTHQKYSSEPHKKPLILKKFQMTLK
jgi:hypothetical protein